MRCRRITSRAVNGMGTYLHPSPHQTENSACDRSTSRPIKRPSRSRVICSAVSYARLVPACAPEPPGGIKGPGISAHPSAQVNSRPTDPHSRPSRCTLPVAQLSRDQIRKDHLIVDSILSAQIGACRGTWRTAVGTAHIGRCLQRAPLTRITGPRRTRRETAERGTEQRHLAPAHPRRGCKSAWQHEDSDGEDVLSTSRRATAPNDQARPCLARRSILNGTRFDARVVVSADESLRREPRAHWPSAPSTSTVSAAPARSGRVPPCRSTCGRCSHS